MDYYRLHGDYPRAPDYDKACSRAMFNPSTKEAAMNTEQIRGNFNQIKGKLKETWGRLSDDDIALYNGKRDQFFGKLEEKYGLAKEDAEDKLAEIEQSLKHSDAA